MIGTTKAIDKKSSRLENIIEINKIIILILNLYGRDFITFINNSNLW